MNINQLISDNTCKNSFNRKHTKAEKENLSKANLGPKNPMWKGGHHHHTYRRIAGAKPNDGMIVHHKHYPKGDIHKKDLKVVTPSQHNVLHDKWKSLFANKKVKPKGYYK